MVRGDGNFVISSNVWEFRAGKLLYAVWLKYNNESKREYPLSLLYNNVALADEIFGELVT